MAFNRCNFLCFVLKFFFLFHYFDFKKVDPDGATLAVGFNDGVLRFLKICPKASQAGQFEIKVLEAFKPHTKAIKKIAIYSKSAIIATGVLNKLIF